jgi:prepilin-type processing-associated H-X9-DG protein
MLGADTWGDYKTAWFKLYNPGTGVANYNGSYTLNGWLYATDRYTAGYAFFKDSAVKNSAMTPIFGDGNWVDCWPDRNDPPWHNLQTGDQNPPDWQIARYLIARHGPQRPAVPPLNASFAKPFPGGINIVFFDGHVENVSLNNLWSLTWHQDLP